MLGRKSEAQSGPKTINPETVAQALAKAVLDGDIVNFRFLFSPASPARPESSQAFEMRKYGHLLPDAETAAAAPFQRIVELVKQPATWRHVERELREERPAQLPSELVLPLADNAVRLGKLGSAAQAYELLRVRARMQREFFAQADAALDAGDVKKGVHGYLIAAGLGYDYAAFPEPQPATPDYQTRALVLHADYPERAEDCLGMLEPEQMMDIALAYLLLDEEAAAALRARPLPVRAAFVAEVVRLRDPHWADFAERFRGACLELQNLGAQIGGRAQRSGLEHEIRGQQTGDPRRISAQLLGRTLDGGEWWQYLKELAYEHPAAVLFVARQETGSAEVLIPMHRSDSPIAQALGMAG